MYRYLIIHHKNGKILYGECIEWKQGRFDLDPLPRLSFNLTKNYKALVYSSDKPLGTSVDGCVEIENLRFEFHEVFDDFIKLTLDEVIYNPLTDRCSKVTLYYGEEKSEDEFRAWADNEAKLLEQVKLKLDIDFLRNPQKFKKTPTQN